MLGSRCTICLYNALIVSYIELSVPDWSLGTKKFISFLLPDLSLSCESLDWALMFILPTLHLLDKTDHHASVRFLYPRRVAEVISKIVGHLRNRNRPFLSALPPSDVLLISDVGVVGGLERQTPCMGSELSRTLRAPPRSPEIGNRRNIPSSMAHFPVDDAMCVTCSVGVMSWCTGMQFLKLACSV